MDVQKYISPLIASQFPSFYESEGPNFVAFMQAYYEWLEQTGNVAAYTRALLDTFDIDKTTSQFVQYFCDEYIDLIPQNIAADKRLLIKHIIDLYRSKGTKRAVEMLFRIIFNEDIGIYIPGDFLFKTSAAHWSVPQYIEVSDSPYLFNLVGRRIYNSSASAIVESYNARALNNRLVNILYISNLEGSFRFDEQIYCADLLTDSSGDVIDLAQFNTLTPTQQLAYSPALTSANAPRVFGSLSALGIINGGENFNIGDVVTSTDVRAAQALVISTTVENGKVGFDLINGGYGFSLNAIVTVTGGSGTGANFSVGGITNISVFYINTDIISDYYNTILDISTSGVTISINTSTGNMTASENITASANVVPLDVRVVSGTVSNNDTLTFTNPIEGTISLLVDSSDHSLVYVTGTEPNLTHANLVNGVELTSNGGAIIQINTNFGKETITGNAVVISANSSVVVANFVNGYFVANSTITGGTSGKTANVVSLYRNTNWNFPGVTFANTNLDQLSLGIVLVYYTIEAGTITFLSNVNPGEGYSSGPTASIVEPLIYALSIPDGANGYWGFDAVVATTAQEANGIVSGLRVIDSSIGFMPGETLHFENPNNQASVDAAAIVDLNGIGLGRYLNNVGFPSDESFIEDGDFYQVFSYEILANRMLSTYQAIVEQLVHPSGMKLFGAFVDAHTFAANSSVLSSKVSRIDAIMTANGAATGTSTAAAVGRNDVALGASAGVSTAAAVGNSIFVSVASAASVSVANGISTIIQGVGTAIGTSTAHGISQITVATAASTSASTAAASGRTTGIAFGVGAAPGTATVLGVGNHI